MPLPDWLTLSFIYSVSRDAWSSVTGRKARKTKADLDSRERWKDKIQEYLYDIRSKKLRSDIVIRDFRRFNQYPNTDDRAGISPWFKVNILDIYHNGIRVGLKVSSIIYESSERSWRKASEGERENSTNAILVGYIPFRNIESIDFAGDEYYSFPHVVCHFFDKGSPYEYLRYCEKRNYSEDSYYYKELESEEKVRLTSEKFGTHKEW